MTEKLKPTTEPPKEPGWYWVKLGPHSAWQPLYVGLCVGQLRLWHNGCHHAFEDWPDSQWAGPLPKPE